MYSELMEQTDSLLEFEAVKKKESYITLLIIL